MIFTMEKYRNLNGSVTVKDEFWSPKLKRFFEVTLPDTFYKFEKVGTLDNYRNYIQGKDVPHHGYPFHDGLLYEAIRGAADYLRYGNKSEALEKQIDGYIELFAEAQQKSGGGYLHTFIFQERPHQRFGENGGTLLWHHDLYNHGCLIEAAVHYYLATGKTKLLDVAVRAANELVETIGEPPKKYIVPGHELPEYAMLELYELFMDEPELANRLSVKVDPESYHELSRFWIYGRGHHEHRTNNPQYLGEYAQDHAPIHQQFQAVGHAVRAVLYYTGITREAMIDGDTALLEDSLRLWENVVTRKLHINGGIGATHFEEKFGADYDLVNTAYLETCATVGLIFWAESLSRATGDARFYQIIEKALYNLMLSSVSLQGDSYFYRNPLSSDGADHRWAWHNCPCCPPMFHKTFGMFQKFIYAQDDERLFVNLFVGTNTKVNFPWGEAVINTESELPWNGKYKLTVEKADRAFRLLLRVPEWKIDLVFYKNGEAVEPVVSAGYACMDVSEGDIISFVDTMPVRRVEAHPYVNADKGRIAIMRGPMVYCVEGIDNHGEAEIKIAKNPEFTIEQCRDLLGGIVKIHGGQANGERFQSTPLYTWDNRSACKMRVWLEQEGKTDSWNVDGWENKLYRNYGEKKISQP